VSPPQTPFEDVIDAGRRSPDDEAAQRRVAMVRENDAEAALEWQLLEDFDDQRGEALTGPKLDAIAQSVLAKLREPEPEVARGPTPRHEPEPEVARGPTPPREPEPEVASGAPHRVSLAQSTTRRFAVAVGAVPSRLRVGLAAAAVVGLSLATGWYARGVNDSTPTELPLSAEATRDESPAAQPGAVDPPAHEAERAPRAASPGVLLSRAERAKGLGRAERAAALYRRILREAPRGREAEMARLGLARLLLEDLDAPERALEQFDAYLARYPEGLLRPEAQVGRAEALGQAGRISEERRAWRDVLDNDPEGAAADLARHAIEAEIP